MGATWVCWVHPRARGERAGHRGLMRCCSGSSPRTRGTHGQQFPPRQTRRFIPAHAGNALCVDENAALSPVHPRARGERTVSNFRHGRRGGSSPRTRGTHTLVPPSEALGRFIPAHAGNADAACECGPQRTVHPRARGERPASSVYTLVPPGSSPRTRGTLSRVGRLAVTARFIPAHAGNAFLAPQSCPAGPVHPRARGERIGNLSWRAQGIGSSPRTRGTHGARRVLPRVGRFIPAHAGNARRQPRRRGARSVHPRARGERLPGATEIVANTGSSPRTRGTRHPDLHPGQVRRFIPAHAGNASWSLVGGSPCAVHPRARGER